MKKELIKYLVSAGMYASKTLLTRKRRTTPAVDGRWEIMMTCLEED